MRLGDWSDDVPIINPLDDAQSVQIYDRYDAAATGTATVPTDTGILDARDAQASGTGTIFTAVPSSSNDGGSSWSFSDVLHAGAGLLRDLRDYHATQLPNGAAIYTRTDAFGRPVQATSYTTLGTNDVMGMVRQYWPIAALGIGVLLLAGKKGR